MELCDFELAVLKGLRKCGVPLFSFNSDADLVNDVCAGAELNGTSFVPQSKKLRLGVGVSGGADSVSLLVSLCHLSKFFEFEVYALSVNHNIREEKESLSDSEYVVCLCKKLEKLGFCIEGHIVSLPKGLVSEVMLERKNGLEEAARFLRYKEFEKFSKEKNIDFFCLAHNQNDQIETILMRFIQGSSLIGINEKRGIFVRPLLDLNRISIEKYLLGLKIQWKTDSTNSENNYLRNRIRNVLVPVLDENFAMWRQGVLASGVKAKDDFDAILESYGKVFENAFKEGKMSSFDFMKLPLSVRIKILFNRVMELGFEGRFPYRIIRNFSLNLKKTSALGIDFFEECGFIFVKKSQNKATESCFFAIIEEDGRFSFPFGFIDVQTENGSSSLIFENSQNGKTFVLRNVRLPVCVRSAEISDCVFQSDGKRKSVRDVFSSWHVPSSLRKLIPVVQRLDDYGFEISCIPASIFGYSDWIVRGENEY